MSNIKVNYSELANLNAKHQQAAAQIQQLKTSLQGLLAGTEWTGEAKKAALQTFENVFGPAFRALEMANVAHGQNIQKVSTGFADVDQDFGRRLRG